MNTSQNTPENTSSDQSRPFGFWITAVDRLLAAEFATAFEDEGITRRDWRILNIVDGTVPRGTKAAGRSLPEHKLRRLADLGWVERGADGWALTTDGAAAKARLSTAVEEIRAQVAGALDPEEFAAMAASLEKLARGLGYEEGMRLPRRPAAERGERRHRGDRRGHGRHHAAHRHEAGFAHAGHVGHAEHFGHAEHRHEAGFGHADHVGHGDHFGPAAGFGHAEHRHEADFGHAGHIGHAAPERFGDHPGFGREWLRREHRHAERCGEHARGMGRRGGHPRHAEEHLHVHLHHGRHDG